MKVLWFSKRRSAYLVALIGISALGIASRVFYAGNLLWDKYLGDAIYAVVFYLFLSIIWERGTPELKAVLTLVFVLVVELFQLTLIPIRFSMDDSLVLRLVAILLGTQFAWLDIVAYLVGIAAVSLADRQTLASGDSADPRQ